MCKYSYFTLIAKEYFNILAYTSCHYDVIVSNCSNYLDIRISYSIKDFIVRVTEANLHGHCFGSGESGPIHDDEGVGEGLLQWIGEGNTHHNRFTQHSCLRGLKDKNAM